jgi:hypothetical protein
METSVHSNSTHYLDDGWVSEGVKQDVHVMSDLEGVYEVVMEAGGYLHEARETQESPVRVVLHNG